MNGKKDGKTPDLIRLVCKCGKRVKVSIKFAGKTGTCPKCGETVKIPPLKKKAPKAPTGKKKERADFDVPSLPSLKEIHLEDSDISSAPSSQSEMVRVPLGQDQGASSASQATAEELVVSDEMKGISSSIDVGDVYPKSFGESGSEGSEAQISDEDIQSIVDWEEAQEAKVGASHEERTLTLDVSEEVGESDFEEEEDAFGPRIAMAEALDLEDNIEIAEAIESDEEEIHDAEVIEATEEDEIHDAEVIEVTEGDEIHAAEVIEATEIEVEDAAEAIDMTGVLDPIEGVAPLDMGEMIEDDDFPNSSEIGSTAGEEILAEDAFDVHEATPVKTQAFEAQKRGNDLDDFDDMDNFGEALEVEDIQVNDIFPQEATSSDFDEDDEDGEVEAGLIENQVTEEDHDEVFEVEGALNFETGVNFSAVDALPANESEIFRDVSKPLLHVENIEDENIVGGDALTKGWQTFQEGELEISLMYLCECIHKNEDRASAYYVRSLLYMKKHAWELALENIESARKEGYDENDIEIRLNQILYYRAQSFKDMGAYKEALDNLDRIISSNTQVEKGKVHWLHAKKLFREGAYQSALPELEEAIFNNYLEPEVFETRGKIYFQQRDYESAMHDFTAAINRGGKNSFLHRARSESFYKLRQLDEALADIEEAIEISPEDAQLYDLQGLIYTDKGDVSSADRSFEQSFGLDPDNPIHNFNRGLSYIVKGRYDRAIDDFTKVINQNPKDRVAYLKRAFCYQEKTNPNLAQAREDFKAAETMETDTLYRSNNSAWFTSSSQSAEKK